MSSILQRNWHTSVRQENGDLLKAQIIYCGTDCEKAARLIVDASSFKIIEAVLENYSPPVRTIRIDGLKGEEAYFNVGPVLKKELQQAGDFSRSLFADTVRGIIQAETFIWDKRGYSSPASYNDFWDKFYLNSCHYYSNLDRVTQKWDEYVAYTRTSNLFNRFKHQAVNKIHDDGLIIYSRLSDSFHEMSIELELDMQFNIKKASGDILRAPDPICIETTSLLTNLQGICFKNLSKKSIAELLGSGNGCVHLIDMVYDAVHTVKIIENGGGKIK